MSDVLLRTVRRMELERRVEAWVSSAEGMAQLLATKDAARIAAEKVVADARIELEQLRQAYSDRSAAHALQAAHTVSHRREIKI
jgi:hypothetical protein